MKSTKNGEDTERVDTNQRVIHLQQWMTTLSERKKWKESILCIHGIYNTTGGEKHNGEDPKKCGNNFPPCQTKGIIYERLCLGVRYLEMVVLLNFGMEEGKSDLRFACGGGCIYSASDLMEEVGVFFLSNKKERVVLSFLLRGGDNNAEDDDKENDNKGNHDKDDEKDDADSATQLLDVYMYLYLRRELKHAEGDENYRVLYFLNDRERFLNLGKYQFDIDHFVIRNWIFNNMSLLLPSRIVHRGEENSEGEGEDKRLDEKGGNVLTPLFGPPQREKSTLLSLPQQHHMSLFRLNSMQNDQVPNLSSKVCIKGKFPNILITTQGDDQLADSKQGDSLLPNENAHRRTNTRRYYIEWEGDHHSGGTLHSVDTHDGNLTWSGKFIGSNNLPLTEYVIDVPRQHKLLSSPFTFLNKKLVYLCQEGELFKGKDSHRADTNTTYYVIKTGRDGLKDKTVQSYLAQFAHQFSADVGPCWICILAQDFHIKDVFDVICVNFCTPKGCLR
ncbi:Uncharacterized protein PCOAH_00043600 [Plasmodium coatneyi]|uniref:Uncharacterized protein n=1 Tax=Plasmodium coatneyi TaxID=208452 RepID=A0A1B1E672_9APIC|nr:Uncharacterized protein PCOAH_00043600 [Plasmodium coatneyi]ANQ10259.1 Uncharacterized protein PCOAH_00043600 [Plasmodium coatneyi]